MKELYEAGFCFKECTGLVDNFHITTRLSCLRFSGARGAVDRTLAVIVLVILRGSDTTLRHEPASSIEENSVLENERVKN